MSTAQLVAAVVAACLGSNVIAVALTLYFTRGKTRAEEGKVASDAHKAEAEASGEWLDQLKSTVAEWQKVMGFYADCERNRAKAEIRVQEVEADNRQLRAANELLTKQDTVWQEQVTEMRERLREAGKL